MPADIGVSGVEKHPSFFRPLFPAFSFFSIYTQSFASRTYGSHLRVSGWISLIPLRPALSSDVSRMISKLESFSFLPFCLLSISAYRFDVNNPASFGVMFVTRRFFFFLLLWMTSFHMPISCRLDPIRLGLLFGYRPLFFIVLPPYPTKRSSSFSPPNGDDNPATKENKKKRRNEWLGCPCTTPGIFCLGLVI